MTFPSPLSPPPRAVRLRGEARLRVRMMRCATLPFLAAATFMTWSIAQTPLTLVLGDTMPARYADVRPSPRGAPGRHFDVTFNVDVGNGVLQTGYGRVDTDLALPPNRGDKTFARVLHLGPLGTQVALDDHLRDRRFSGYLCGGLFISCGAALRRSGPRWCGSAPSSTDDSSATASPRRAKSSPKTSAGAAAHQARNVLLVHHLGRPSAHRHRDRTAEGL